jgi:hypothetical protein
MSGFDTIKILTYSNSISVIRRVAELFDDIEIIFGREDIINQSSQLIHFQQILLESLHQEIVGTENRLLLEKIKKGKLRFFVVQNMLSHEKLYLLNSYSSNSTRVISGSANLSENGFGGKQNESFIYFDNDELAWQSFSKKYESIKEKSAQAINQGIFLSPRIEIKDLPILSPARSIEPQIIVIDDLLPQPTIIQKFISQKPSKSIIEAQRLIQNDKGIVKIDRKTALNVIQYVKNSTRSETDNPDEYLSIHIASKKVILAGKELDLLTEPKFVKNDVQMFLNYFEGFQHFRGNTERLQRDFFTFMSWLYISPFICDFRAKAMRNGEYIYDYPHYGILHGKSNCGKSELIKMLLRSMFGKEGFLEKDWFTKSRVKGLYAENKRYPMAFDDIDSSRFSNHAIELIKEDYLNLPEYPAVILSMNADRESYESEIKKRCLVIYTDASLPDHTGESRELARKIKHIKNNIGTSLYHYFLSQVLEEFCENGLPTDIIAFSTQILVDIFKEHTETLPSWCQIRTINQYSESKHDKVKKDLLEIWQYQPEAWEIKGHKLTLKLDNFTLRRLIKDIPDYTHNNLRGDIIVFNKTELESFLDTSLEKNKGSFLGKIFGK